MSEDIFNDFSEEPMAREDAINLDEIDTEKLPTFSIVVPTWEDPEGLGRTLCNIVYQSDMAKKALREVIVVGDGYEEAAYKMCAAAQEFANTEEQNVKIWYFNMKTHTGNGNYPRAAGLKKARQEWTLFLDAGTSVCYNCFATLISVIQKKPTAKLITWDIVQLLDPVPITSVSQLVATSPRDQGLPYVIPGVAAALRTEIATKVEWPNVRASDWAYFSQIWEVMYGPPEAETEDIRKQMNEEVFIIPWVLVVAYGARTKRKERAPATLEQFNNEGHNLGWREASKRIEEPSGNIVGPDGKPAASGNSGNTEAVPSA